MARNTQVAADHHAPPITHTLAEYVAQPDLDSLRLDAALEGKFHDLADGVIGAARTGELIQALWATGGSDDLRRISSLAQP